MTDSSNHDAFLSHWKKNSGVASSEAAGTEAETISVASPKMRVFRADTSDSLPPEDVTPRVSRRGGQARWWKRRGLWMGVGVGGAMRLRWVGVCACVGYTVYQ